MENTITCKGRGYVTFLVAITGGNAAIAMLGALGSSVFMFVLFGAFTLMFAVDLFRTCSRVDLRSENELVLHFFLRQRVVHPSSITSIELDKDPDGESPDKFIVVFDGGKFHVSANRSARQLMDALLRLKPTITAERGAEDWMLADGRH